MAHEQITTRQTGSERKEHNTQKKNRRRSNHGANACAAQVDEAREEHPTVCHAREIEHEAHECQPQSVQPGVASKEMRHVVGRQGEFEARSRVSAHRGCLGRGGGRLRRLGPLACAHGPSASLHFRHGRVGESNACSFLPSSSSAQDRPPSRGPLKLREASPGTPKGGEE